MTPDPSETAEPNTLRRLLLVGPKLKARGWSWLRGRLKDELRKPATRPGRWLRCVTAGIYGAALSGIFLPLRLLWAPRRTVVLFYDLEVSPITYDFCFSLINAELIRARRRLDHIEVVIVPGPADGLRTEDEDYETAVDPENRRWRIANILLPLCRLVPSVSGVTLCATRRQATAIRGLSGTHLYPRDYWPRFPRPHTPNEVLDAARGGKIARPFRAPEQARRYVRRWLLPVAGRRAVTITLRQYEFMPRRNSNLVAWGKLAEFLEGEGFAPVFVPDADAAFDPLPDVIKKFPVFTDAAMNVELRMALYEAAWLNMLVNNGPFGCAAFSDSPYLMFKILTPGVRMTCQAYMKSLGYEIGVTPPFCSPFQKWVWEDDDLPVLMREFADMRKKLESRDIGQ